jgi:putative DNA primase/helicase
MADFARWVTAAEPALGFASGTILKAYRKNLSGAAAIALEASPVAVAVRGLVRDTGTWGGTADALLAALLPYAATEGAALSRAWPKDGARLSGRLRRDAVPLRAAGIEIEFTTHGRGKTKSRWINLQQRTSS